MITRALQRIPGSGRGPAHFLSRLGLVFAGVLLLAAACRERGPEVVRGTVAGVVRADPDAAGWTEQPDWIVSVGDTGSDETEFVVPRATVRFENLDDGSTHETVTDERGAFSASLPAGNWRARASYVAEREFTDVAAFGLGPAGATLELSLEPSALLYGRVSFAGEETATAKIELVELGDYALADTEGAWLLHSVPAGTWTVAVHAEGYASRSSEVTLAPGDRRNLGEMRLNAEGAQTGVRYEEGSLLVVVSDPTGQPVPETLCALEGLGVYGLAGSDGVARLTSRTGAYTIVCQKDGYEVARKHGVRIPGDGTPATISLTMAPRHRWGGLIVDVIDHDGYPISSAGIDLWTYERTIGALYTDGKGRVRFDSTDCVGLQSHHASYEPSIPFQACPNYRDGKENYYLVTMCQADECPDVYACLNGTRDCTPPETTISQAPTTTIVDMDGTAQNAFVFAFAADEEAEFFCQVDGSDWTPCTSPHVVEDLDYGLHTFRVYARDKEGNIDHTPAAHAWSWQIDADLHLYVENCFPENCGVHDVLNQTGWSPATDWLNVTTTPDLAFADETTGIFVIRTDWVPVGRHYVQFNAGSLPVYHGAVTTPWLFGFEILDIDDHGHPFHSQDSWLRVEYADGTTDHHELSCDHVTLELIDKTQPDRWDSHVGRGSVWMSKGFDGRLSFEPAGNPDYYSEFFEEHLPYYKPECIEDRP